MGGKIFSEKVAKYKEIKKKFKYSQTLNFCHFCLEPISDPEPKKCNNEMAKEIITSLILTDPFVFYENILCEYFPKMSTKQEYIHPYLKYYKAGKNQKQYVCNRYICDECFIRYYEGFYGACEYCEGSCDCPRCSSLDFLVKALGLYFAYS